MSCATEYCEPCPKPCPKPVVKKVTMVKEVEIPQPARHYTKMVPVDCEEACPPKTKLIAEEVCVKKERCPPPCEPVCDPCAPRASSYDWGYGWGWLGALVLWFIIFIVLFWLIFYSLRPSFVLVSGGTAVDTAKVLLAAVIAALILIIIVWIIKAAISWCRC